MTRPRSANHHTQTTGTHHSLDRQFIFLQRFTIIEHSLTEGGQLDRRECDMCGCMHTKWVDGREREMCECMHAKWVDGRECDMCECMHAGWAEGRECDMCEWVHVEWVDGRECNIHVWVGACRVG